MALADDELRAVRRDLKVYWVWSSTLGSSPTLAWCLTLACQEWRSDYSESGFKHILSMESYDRVLSQGASFRTNYVLSNSPAFASKWSERVGRGTILVYMDFGKLLEQAVVS